ncbi:Gfo/Idh/MocA family protein [Membranihabitans maritimus]|uniref:Gfo/Idh/MocA family protein n=1 Tax=Membranihabitans maritimus TaxID=2904244 RepID=UPI001F249D0C|nr:Gfo/Idh/MocA family oxidoreductase [Membranihabitans maritimus]
MTKRRSFIKKLVAGTVAYQTLPELLKANKKNSVSTFSIGKRGTDSIRLGLIGKGGMGTSNARTALRVEDTELITVCDLYDGRLEEVAKTWGDKISTTREYREVLDNPDVDAVIVATPDHWHQKIAIDAMKAGKHVYCEKPVIHKLQEGADLIKAQEETGSLFQMGSQGMASLGNRVAKVLVRNGAIGSVNSVEAKFTRPPGSLDPFVAPDGASPETIWWDRFIGPAPDHSYDAQRFFSWRNWRDYGTGLAGDLFVHVISSLHFITDSLGPQKVYTTGDIYHYTNGSRDTPDIMLGFFDYPNRNNLGAFTMSLGANYVDGISGEWGSTDFDIIGNKGKLEVGWNTVVLKTVDSADMDTFRELSSVGQGMDHPRKVSDKEFVFQAEKGYKGGHYDHWNNFITGIRKGGGIESDVKFGVRASSAALLSFNSYLKEQPVFWDPENMKEI